MAVQAQWNLDRTIGSAVSVGLGVLRAASRDNVQPLAILACEKFGNTLAMCQDTCRKVELAMITPDPVYIGFLRATVGFFADDCGSQLSRSLAGLRFLGLATALVSSMEPFEAANTLEQLLKKSTSDLTLLPTVRQLKGLLETIEPRCHASGFGNSMTGWRIFLGGSDIFDKVDERLKPGWTKRSYYPSIDGIESLVDGLRQISRIGDAKKTFLTIYTSFCTPWVLSFIKWCLGMPPTIVLDDDEATTILDSPGSPVLVIVMSQLPNSDGFRMCISSSLQDITDIVRHPEVLSEWRQLMTIETYGKIRLLEVDLDSGSGYRALCQALPYCVHMVLKDMRFDAPSADHLQDYQDRLAKFSLSPLPRACRILEIASRMLGMRETPGSASLEDGLCISDLPVVKLHLETLSTDCGCKTCSLRNPKATEFFGSCLKVRFFQAMASLTTEIIALSLFNNAKSLLVRLISTMGIAPFTKTFKVVFELIRGQEEYLIFTEISDLLDLALDLCGHFSSDQDSDIRDRWVMSSKRGQTVYLSILESQRIDKEGFLRLDWLPGLIQYDGDAHNTVLASTPLYCNTHMSERLTNVPVTMSADLTLYEFAWWVRKQDGHLEVGIGAHDKQLTQVTRSPRAILENLARLRVLSGCAHDPDSRLVEADRSCTYTLPLEPHLVVKHKSSHVSVVAVAGNDRMRFLALNGNDEIRKMVLRMNVCLSCCLKFCRLEGFDVLIL